MSASSKQHAGQAEQADCRTTTYRAVLAANIRAERARLDITQKDLASRMALLGHRPWEHYQTTGKVERSERQVTAEEILGLALALNTTVAALMSTRPGDQPVALTPDVVFDAGVVGGLAYGTAAQFLPWDGGKLA